MQLILLKDEGLEDGSFNIVLRKFEELHGLYYEGLNESFVIVVSFIASY